MTVEDTLEQMLDPYIPECRYLLKAEINFPEAKGIFEVPHPFYCVKTGHFNATELMICYNQLAYVSTAEFCDKGMIESIGFLSIEEFKKYQAKSCYIARAEFKFKKPINPKEFEGIIKYKKTPRKGNSQFFLTEFLFKDKKGGNVNGEILLAMILEDQEKNYNKRYFLDKINV